MNKDTLKMMEKIDDRFIEEALTNDDVECLNESRGVKKYTVMRYAAACLVGLAGIGAAAFGIVKMNGGGKGTENVGIVGEVTENESTKEEAIQKPTIVPNKIVINRSEAPKEDGISEYWNYNYEIQEEYEYFKWARIHNEEFINKMNEDLTKLTKEEMFQYYGLQKLSENFDSIMEESFGVNCKYYGNHSIFFSYLGEDYYGIWNKEDAVFDVNHCGYVLPDGRGIYFSFEKDTNCYRPGLKKIPMFKFEWSTNYLSEDMSEPVMSEILGKEVCIIKYPYRVDNYIEYEVRVCQDDVNINIGGYFVDEKELVEFIEKIIQRGLM